MANQLPRCKRCVKRFRPNRFNRHHQVYCTDPVCVAARHAACSGAGYGRKYEDDPAFRLAEQERCACGIRRRRAAAVAAACVLPPSPTPNAPPVSVPAPFLGIAGLAVLTGLLAKVLDTDDRAEVSRQLNVCLERGQRLAGGGEFCGVPDG